MSRIVKNIEQDQGASTASPTGPAPFGLSPASGSQAEPLVPSAGHTPGPWAATPMVGGCNNAFYISGNLAANNAEVDIGTVGPSLSPSMAANARLIAAAPELLEALLQIDGEAPAQETRDGPSVGFPPSRDPEIDDGNEVVREAFDEGVCRGLAIAAGIARAAITKALGSPVEGEG